MNEGLVFFRRKIGVETSALDSIHRQKDGTETQSTKASVSFCVLPQAHLARVWFGD
jgi:hypothetical protein